MATVIEREEIKAPTRSLELPEQMTETGASVTPVTDKPAKKGSFLKTAALSVIGVGVVAGAGLWWLHASSIEETDDAYITGHVHQLSAKVAGTVAEVTVDDNQHVKAGQLLIKIDPRDLQISAASARAAVAKAHWQAVEAQSTIVGNERQAESQNFQASSAIASARAGVSKAREALNDAKLGVLLSKTTIQQRQAELNRASLDYDRYSSLVKDRAVTTQSFDTAKQDKEVAQANLEAAQAVFDQAQVKVKEAQQSLLDAQATAVRALGSVQSAAAARAQTETSKKTANVQQAAAKQAEAEYDNALTQLSYTNLAAPISGTIGHKTVEVGQQIERGQALMSVVSDQKWVVANFKETQVGRMHPGQEVEIKIDSLPGKSFKGKVDSLSPASGAQFSMLPPDNASGNFTKVVQRIPVKIVFDADSIKGFESSLTPGMSVLPEVHVGK